MFKSRSKVKVRVRVGQGQVQGQRSGSRSWVRVKVNLMACSDLYYWLGFNECSKEQGRVIASLRCLYKFCGCNQACMWTRDVDNHAAVNLLYNYII